MKRLNVYISNCWGCKSCEKACASAKLSPEEKSRVSRINVMVKNKDERAPVTCLQCEDAACVMACMFGALSRNEATGAVELSQTKCTRCYACLTACPFGNIIFDKKTENVAKCDLCAGAPECAKVCPSKTLMYE